MDNSLINYDQVQAYAAQTARRARVIAGGWAPHGPATLGQGFGAADVEPAGDAGEGADLSAGPLGDYRFAERVRDNFKAAIPDTIKPKASDVSGNLVAALLFVAVLWILERTLGGRIRLPGNG